MAATIPVLPSSVPHPSPTSIARKPHRLESVQIMRAVAALMVCVWHLAFTTNELYPSSLTIALRRLPLGMWGVDLFFVVSGFIMMYTTLPQFGQPGSARRFAIKRLARIVPSYWFFTSLMVFMTIAMPASLRTTRFTPSHALLSFLFIPHIGPEPALIQPLYSLGWTLNYEMFFYAIFAIAVLFKPRTGLIIILATFGLAFISARFGVWDRAFNLFWGDSILFEFLLGIAAFYLCRRYEPKIVGRSLLLAAALVWMVVVSPINIDDRLLNGGVPAFVVFIALFRLHMRGLIARALVALGDASYSLYLSHSFVIAVFVGAAARWGPKGGPSEILSAVLFGTSLIACIVVSILFYRYCERPVTNWLSNQFLGRRPEAGAGPVAVG